MQHSSRAPARTKRVNAIILGAQKCATTSLFFALRASPEIECSKVKEADFFSKTPDWKANLDHYHALFRRERPVLLEASPSYTCFPFRNHGIWRDMHEYNPDLRLIYITRHPVDRMRSAYRHSFERGGTEEGFEEFLLTNQRALDRSRYAMQIRPYIETFGRERVLLLQFEDVVRRQREVARQVAGFLGIDDGFADRVGAVHLNDGRKRKFHQRFDRPGLALRVLDKVARPAATWWKRRHSPSMRDELAVPEDIRAKLIALLLPDIIEFEAISGWDLAAWKR